MRQPIYTQRACRRCAYAKNSIGLDESIREDVALIKDWQFLPQGARVVGYAYHVETGALREVVDGGVKTMKAQI